MIFEDVTIQDCHREAWLESQVKVAQRKIDRLCKEISLKEEIAQRLMSPWFCQHYDNQIGRRYEEMAQLEGAVRAAQLELDRLADKRYADKARRLAAIALIEEVGKKAMTGTTPASSPSSSTDPRQKQQAMFFGPGAPPAAPPKSSSPSVTIDQKAEDDIARAFEICHREIPPPDPTPATATPSTPPSTPISSEKPVVTPLTHPTLARLAMPAAVAEPASVNRLGDSAADSFARTESVPHQEDSSSIEESAAPSNECDSADAQSPTGMPNSVAPTDSQSAVPDRTETQSTGDDNDGTELTEGNEAEGLE
jgi:hypothetical protein